MNITKDQWASLGRHAITAVSSGIAVLTVTHLVSAHDAQSLTTGFNQIEQGVQSIIAGVTVIMPVAMGVWSMISASMKSRIKAVNNGDNGVKVVAASSPSPQVSAPLK